MTAWRLAYGGSCDTTCASFGGCKAAAFATIITQADFAAQIATTANPAWVANNFAGYLPPLSYDTVPLVYNNGASFVSVSPSIVFVPQSGNVHRTFVVGTGTAVCSTPFPISNSGDNWNPSGASNRLCPCNS